jgi:hypothetical protein
MVKNHASVLRTNIVSLPVERGGIVRLPENGEQFIESNLFWVVKYLDHFSMAGLFITNLFVRGINNMSSTVTGSNFQNTLQLLEDRFCTPETTRSQSSRIRLYIFFQKHVRIRLVQHELVIGRSTGTVCKYERGKNEK